MSTLRGTFGATFALPPNTFPIIPCEGTTPHDKPVLLTVASANRTIGTISSWQDTIPASASSSGIAVASGSPQFIQQQKLLKKQQEQQLLQHEILAAAGNLSRKIEVLVVAEKTTSTATSSAAAASAAASSSSSGSSSSMLGDESSSIVLAISRRNRGFWAVVAISWQKGQFTGVDLTDGFDRILRKACGITSVGLAKTEPQFFSIEGATVCPNGERIAFVVRNTVSAAQTALVVGSLGAPSWTMIPLTDPIIPPGSRIVTAWTAANTCTVAFARVHPVVSNTHIGNVKAALQSWFREGIDRRERDKHISFAVATATGATGGGGGGGNDPRSPTSPTSASAAAAAAGGGGGGGIQRLEQLANELPVCVVLQFLAITVTRTSLRISMSNRGTIRSHAFAVSTPVNEIAHPVLRFCSSHNINNAPVKLAAVIDSQCYLVDIPSIVWSDGGVAQVVTSPAPLSREVSSSAAGNLISTGTSNYYPNTNQQQGSASSSSSSSFKSAAPVSLIEFIGAYDPVAFFVAQDEASDHAVILMSSSSSSSSSSKSGNQQQQQQQQQQDRNVVGIAARDIIGTNEGPARFHVVKSNWLVLQSGPRHCAAICVRDIRQQAFFISMQISGGNNSSSNAMAMMLGSSSSGVTSTAAIEMREPGCVNFFLAKHQQGHIKKRSSSSSSSSSRRGGEAESEKIENVGHELRLLDSCVHASSSGDIDSSSTFGNRKIEENSVFAVFERLAATQSSSVRLKRIKAVAASCISSTQSGNNNKQQEQEQQQQQQRQGAAGNTKWVMHVAAGHESTIRTLGMLCLASAFGVPLYVTGFESSSSSSSSSSSAPPLTGIRASLWAAPGSSCLVIPPTDPAASSSSSSFHNEVKQLGEFAVDLLACSGDLPLALLACAYFARTSVAATVIELCCSNHPLIAHLIQGSEMILARIALENDFRGKQNSSTNKKAKSKSSEQEAEIEAKNKSKIASWNFASHFASCTTALELFEVFANDLPDPLNEADTGVLILVFLCVNSPEWFASFLRLSNDIAAGGGGVGGGSNNASKFAILGNPLVAMSLWVHATRIHMWTANTSSSSSSEVASTIGNASDFLRLHRSIVQPLFPLWQQIVIDVSNENQQQQQQQESQSQKLNASLAAAAAAGGEEGSNNNNNNNNNNNSATPTNANTATIKEQTVIDFVAFYSCRLIGVALRCHSVFQDLGCILETLRKTLATSSNSVSAQQHQQQSSMMEKAVEHFLALREFFGGEGLPLAISQELQLLNILVSAGRSDLFIKIAKTSRIPLLRHDLRARQCFFELARKIDSAVSTTCFDELSKYFDPATQTRLNKMLTGAGLLNQDIFELPVRVSANPSVSPVSHEQMLVFFPQRFSTRLTKLEFLQDFWIELRKFVMCDVVPASVADPPHSPPMLFSVLCECLAMERRVDVYAAIPEAELLLSHHHKTQQEKKNKMKSSSQRQGGGGEGGGLYQLDPAPLSAVATAAANGGREKRHVHEEDQDDEGVTAEEMEEAKVLKEQQEEEERKKPAHPDAPAAATLASKKKKKKQQQEGEEESRGEEIIPIKDSLENPMGSMPADGASCHYKESDVAWWEDNDQQQQKESTGGEEGFSRNHPQIRSQQQQEQGGLSQIQQQEEDDREAVHKHFMDAVNDAMTGLSTKSSNQQQQQLQQQQQQQYHQDPVQRRLDDIIRASHQQPVSLLDQNKSKKNVPPSRVSVNVSSDDEEEETSTTTTNSSERQREKEDARESRKRREKLSKQPDLPVPLLRFNNNNNNNINNSNVMMNSSSTHHPGESRKINQGLPVPLLVPGGGGAGGLVSSRPTSPVKAPPSASHYRNNNGMPKVRTVKDILPQRSSSQPFSSHPQQQYHHQQQQHHQPRSHSASSNFVPPTPLTLMKPNSSASAGILLDQSQSQQQQNQSRITSPTTKTQHFTATISSSSSSSSGAQLPLAHSIQQPATTSSSSSATTARPMNEDIHLSANASELLPAAPASVQEQQQHEQKEQQKEKEKQEAVVAPPVANATSAAEAAAGGGEEKVEGAKEDEEGKENPVASKEKDQAQKPEKESSSVPGDERSLRDAHVADLLAKYGKSSKQEMIERGRSLPEGITLTDVEHVIARQNALLERSISRQLETSQIQQIQQDQDRRSSEAAKQKPERDVNTASSAATAAAAGGGEGGEGGRSESPIKQLAQTTLTWREAAITSTLDAANAQAKADVAIAELKGMVASRQAELNKNRSEQLIERTKEVTSLEELSKAMIAESNQHRVNAEQAIQATKVSTTESAITSSTNALAESEAILKSINTLSQPYASYSSSSSGSQSAAINQSIAGTEFASSAANVNNNNNNNNNNVNNNLAGRRGESPNNNNNSTMRTTVPTSITAPISVDSNAEVLHHHHQRKSSSGSLNNSPTRPTPKTEGGMKSKQSSPISAANRRQPGSMSPSASGPMKSFSASSHSAPSPKGKQAALTPRGTNTPYSSQARNNSTGRGNSNSANRSGSANNNNNTATRNRLLSSLESSIQEAQQHTSSSSAGTRTTTGHNNNNDSAPRRSSSMPSSSPTMRPETLQRINQLSHVIDEANARK